LEEITEGTERCWGMQLWKVVEQVPGRNRESVGGSEMLCEWRVFVGGGARLCLGCMLSGR